MAYIKEIAPEEATGRLKEIYDEILQEPGGRVSPVIQVLSPRPETLRSVRKQGRVLSFGGSTLGRRKEEMIATLTSVLNGCHY